MPTATQKHKLVVVADGMLISMANDATYLAEFPFLKNLARKDAQSCQKCGAGNRETAESFAAAKRAMAGLSSGKKQKLKELLNAHQVRIIYRASGGKTVQLTF